MSRTSPLHALLVDSASRQPDVPAVVFDGEVTTFADLADRVARTMGALDDTVGHGGRVAVVGPNHPGWIDLYYALPGSGRLLVFLNHRLSAVELATLIDRSGASMVIGDDTHLDRLRDATCPIPMIGWEGWADRVGSAPAVEPVELDPDDPAWLLFTSGTTADPKGALLSHANVVAAVASSAAARPVEPDDVYVFPFPLCHVAGYNVVHRHAHGRPVVLLDRFDGPEFCEAVAANGGRSCSLAATMLATILDTIDADPTRLAQLESLRSIAYGASPMTPALLRRADAILGVDLAQGYGMTELSGNAVFLDAERHRRGLTGDEAILRAAGEPAPGVELRIVDDADRDVAPGAVGEILVRAAQMMVGYLDDPTATAAALAGGWLHTGDMGRIDDGLLHVVDRKKDIIITGGENVSSLHVEQVLATHPDVLRVAVVGVPDPTWGESVCAVVVVRDPATFDAASLVAHARDSLGGFEVPRRVVVVDALPVNDSGKVLKTDLRAMLVDDPISMEQGP